VLGFCLLTPTLVLNAADDHHDEHHQWSESENSSWHQYLKEKHRKDHEWAKANKREQADYWKWRDKHH
jgi:hypothetical protein